MISALVSRAEYASLAECVYLNQASLGLLGQPVVEAMHRFLDDVGRHGNLHMSDADEAAYLGRLRELAGRLFRVDAERLAIVSSASEILGQVPHLVSPIAGRTILAVTTDFPSVTRPWLGLAAAGECEVQFVADHPERDLTDDLIAALDSRTALVAVGSVQYGTGTLLDVPRLGAATRRAGARLVIDATQAAGALAIDANLWDADIVVASGYKWLGGHGGVALAVMNPSLLERAPALAGWMGAPDPFDFDATQILWADDARRYTQATMSYVSVAGLTTAIDRLLTLGETRLEAHARRLSEMLVEKSCRRGWQPFRSLSDPAASPHIISLMRPDQNLETTEAALRRAKIVCSLRGGRVRVSLASYNDESDVDALVAALD